MTKLNKTLSQRQLRVGEMVKQALGMIFIRDEAKIPNLDTKHITVTEVRMSPDLKSAKAFVLPLGGIRADESIDKLKEFWKDEIIVDNMVEWGRFGFYWIGDIDPVFLDFDDETGEQETVNIDEAEVTGSMKLKNEILK